jgi:hypothetical protein
MGYLALAKQQFPDPGRKRFGEQHNFAGIRNFLKNDITESAII